MFTLQKDQDTTVLLKNKKPCRCPYQTKLVLPHPQIQGSLMIQEYNCNSSCLFFNEGVSEEGKKEVLTSCTGSRFEIQENKTGLVS